MAASAPPQQPRVTVVLPVWNAGDYLAAAVESIRAQTLADWELLAIDDGSTDGSRQTLEDFARRDSRIVVTSRPNRGLAATLQEGIDRARSETVALMNADDISHPDRLARQLAFLERHPTVAALGTQTRLLVDDRATTIESRLPLSPEACRARRSQSWRRSSSRLRHQTTPPRSPAAPAAVSRPRSSWRTVRACAPASCWRSCPA